VNLCVLSGKGGTGKTTVAVNLAVLLKAEYYDCDVEEPNGFLFLRPAGVKAEHTVVDYPSIDQSKCTLCGQCARACQFSALASTKKGVILFEGLCHGCHACEIVCEPKAISFEKRSVGVVERGEGLGILCARGVLNVGEHMAVPVVRHLLAGLQESRNAILDCAPGTSCNVVNTLRHADTALIVTEPTLFGLHDMAIAVELLRQRNIPFAVVLNKSQDNDDIITRYCADNGIKVLGRIPFSRIAAQEYSKGRLLIDLPDYRQVYEHIASEVREAFPWS
jgi:MinD superfamily P-loop ATPase